ncbi:MAG: HAD family hydrolase [Desulfovibrionaceae bacterium]|nr:HAD family hydrolase [Desulfovibrionaceae bacterium]
MPRALVFDLDGTVLNTLDDIGNSCNFALQKFGYPTHNLKDYEQMVGNGFMVLVIRALTPKIYEQISSEEFNNILEEAKKYYAKHMCERTKPYDGILESLKYLAKQEVCLGVLSNKPEPLTQELIKYYFPKIPFVQVLGGREDQPLKPDPTRVLGMLQELHCQADQSFFIGDSNVDMQTAQAAKMIPIGVAWGFRGATELDQAGAAKLLQHPLELKNLLNL